MKLIPGICTQCGATLSVEEDKEAMVCPYCNVPFVVEKAIQKHNNLYNISAQNVYVQGNLNSDFEIRGGVLEKYTGASVDVVIPDNVVVIGDYSFKNTMIASIKIPDSVNKIGNGAFMDCKVLREVKIPGSVKEIEYSAFSSCASLKRVYLSDGIQKIGEKAFCSCKALEAINMPKSLTDIGRDAFADCSSIKEFGILDSSVSTIREGVLSALGSNVTSMSLLI